MKREDGFYWVLTGPLQEWSIAMWDDGGWDLMRNPTMVNDDYFYKIGPRVQRDSDLVKQRDELLASFRSHGKAGMLASVWVRNQQLEQQRDEVVTMLDRITRELLVLNHVTQVKGSAIMAKDSFDLLARIEAAKSGVTG